ncbi:unnamed protein product [Candida verbasci]|uniref:Uncharacterized protein n=1 Tax=Candida verbasci TaxID=1227364 RepID=A0A9W4XBE3_9ASCO|nr:unnamed protein product [Candida verbasci]
MRYSTLFLLATSVIATPFNFKRYENTTLPLSSSQLPSTPLSSTDGYNAEIAGVSSTSSWEDDSETLTSTIIQYVTITSSSQTLTSAVNTLTSTYTTPKSSSSAEEDDEDWGSETTTSTITSIITVTDAKGQPVFSTETSETKQTIAAESQTSESVETTGASISNSNKEAEALLPTQSSESTAAYCTPSTVTVTVTATPDSQATANAVEQDSTIFQTLTSYITTNFPIQAEFTLNNQTTTLTSYVDYTSTQLITITSTKLASSIAPSYYQTSYSNSTINSW